MKQSKEYKPTNKLTVKDFAELLAVSISTANRYKKDIQQHYNIKTVLYCHYENYFKICQKEAS